MADFADPTSRAFRIWYEQHMRFRRIARQTPFTPLQLFASGEQGAWYDPSDLTTLYLTDAGATNVSSAGEKAGLMADKSPNSVDATQATSAARPAYQELPGRIVLDVADDNMEMDFTGTGGFQATRIDGTKDGCIVTKVNVPDGIYKLVSDPAYPGPGNYTGIVMREGDFTTAEQDSVIAHLKENGSGDDFAGVTSMFQWFRGRTDLVILDAEHWDIGSVTDFRLFAFGCSSLTTLGVSGWNTGNVTSFREFVNACSSLTTFDVSNWDTSSVNSFNRFALDASSLTSLNVSNWNTSSLTSAFAFASGCSSLTTVTVNGGTGNPFADSPCISYGQAFSGTNLSQQSIDDVLVAIQLAGTSNGTFDQSGGSAPSATGEAAIDALRGRGWTITVTGGY